MVAVKFDTFARLTRFMNLVVAAAIRAGDERSRWMAECWTYAYCVELGWLNEGVTYDDVHRQWEAA